MATEWTKADDTLLATVREVIAAHHGRLEGARLAVICRDSTPVSNGRETWAAVSKATPKLNALVNGDGYDWIMWISLEAVDRITPEQLRALIDHELCHCCWKDEDGSPAMRAHDIEEFGEVLERHGWWRGDYGEKEVQRAGRQRELFPVEPRPITVEAPEVARA